MQRKEKVIIGFKILTILIVLFIIVDFLNSLNKEEMINMEMQLEKDAQIKLYKIYRKKIKSPCEVNVNRNSEYGKNSYTYYSFAVILGAFINSKKIMKIGVI